MIQVVRTRGIPYYARKKKADDDNHVPYYRKQPAGKVDGCILSSRGCKAQLGTHRSLYARKKRMAGNCVRPYCNHKTVGGCIPSSDEHPAGSHGPCIQHHADIESWPG